MVQFLGLRSSVEGDAVQPLAQGHPWYVPFGAMELRTYLYLHRVHSYILCISNSLGAPHETTVPLSARSLPAWQALTVHQKGTRSARRHSLEWAEICFAGSLEHDKEEQRSERLRWT